MRTIQKKHAMVLVAMTIAAASVTMMSFRANEATSKKAPLEKVLVDEYWDFIGAANPINNNPLDSTQYQLAPQNTGCVDGSEPCQVYAPSTGHATNPKPDLNQLASGFGSQTIKQRVQAALLTDGNETLTMKN